jgi:glycine/D-amino acid oxidase-like deaminating enzyme
VSPGELSLWLDTCGDDLAPRPPLPGDTEADVAIVGAGLTGLWTAYHLHRLAPGLRVLVLEREIAGFGASGRNGGWCSALFPASWSRVARLPGSSPDRARRLAAALRAAVDDVGAVAAAEGLDVHYARAGTLALARTEVQVRRGRELVAEDNRWGGSSRWLDEDEARTRLDARGIRGAVHTPECATLHPGRLVRGLARVLDGRVTIHEQTAVRSVEPHRVLTDHGVVRASYVVRATEGYTRDLAGHRRVLAPVYSLVIATEPLPDEVWATLGLHGRETFTDLRHLIVYGQRTADGRMVFGGRGAPYHFGSRVRPGHDRDPRVFARLQQALVDLFPALADARITHRWGGPLGIARDWCASVGLDRATGLAWAGGYVGDGVSTTSLAGRTLADLVLGRDTELTTLAWVGHRSPRWEPEPLRWLGVNAGLRAMTLADREERLTGRPSLLARAVAPLTGGH